jgi:hypothetical protein
MKLFSLVFFCCMNSFAYIPPTRVILEKTSDNAGTAAYQIEREVRFSNYEIPNLKETWYVENDRTMRLIVTPLVTPQPGVQPPKFTVLYAGGLKHILWGNSKEAVKVPEEMTERLFHFRRVENLIQYLNQLHILTSTQGNLDLARLNRSQGVVNFGIGKPSEEGSKVASPYLWIDQDAFVIRKIRFSEDTEMTANNYQVHTKGLNYPSVVHLTWADQKVRMNTLSVTMIKKFPPTFFQTSQLEDSKPFQQSFSRWNAVIEFYKRFR